MTASFQLTPPFRALVFGGRDFFDRALLREALDLLHSRGGISEVIHGNAGLVDDETGAIIYGADKFAGEWALDRRARGDAITLRVFDADWKNLGDAAGPARNQRMLVEGQPDVGIGFPRANGKIGNGTADMARRLVGAGLPIWWPKRKPQEPNGGRE